MANMIDNLGLNFLIEDDTMQGFVGAIVSEGKVFKGYYDAPYIQKSFKDAEFVVRCEPNADNEKGGYEIIGFDTHCAGPCVWDTIAKIDITPKDAHYTERRLVVSRNSDDGGMAVVNLVNADVIPSFLDGDNIKMQVVGFPVFINFYDNEDDMYDDVPAPEIGRKMLPAEGAVLPMQFLNNHNPNREDGEEHEGDDVNLVRGKITKMYGGRFLVGDQKPMETFMRIFVDTHFGELELEVSFDALRELEDNEQKKVRVGSEILAGVVISGDVGIYEYDEGKVRDERHDLMAIRHSIRNGEGDRVKSILADDCMYISNVGNWKKDGRDEVAAIFDYVSSTRTIPYNSYLAVLADPDDDFAEEADFKPGKRCLILENENKDYESIMFLTYNDEGDIKKIIVTNETRYKFIFDMPKGIGVPQKKSEQSGHITFAPLNESMCAKAKLFDLIDADAELNEDDLSGESEAYAKQKIMDFSTEGLNDVKDYHRAFNRLFGETFADACNHSGEETYIRKGGLFYPEYRSMRDGDVVKTKKYREEMLLALRYTYTLGKLHANYHKD